MAAGVVLGIIGGAISSVSSIWTSANEVKTTKLEIEKLEEEQALAANLLEKQQLLKALEVKQAAYASAITKEKTNANLRGIVYVIGGGILGFIVWAFTKQNPEALKLKKRK